MKSCLQHGDQEAESEALLEESSSHHGSPKTEKEGRSRGGRYTLLGHSPAVARSDQALSPNITFSCSIPLTQSPSKTSPSSTRELWGSFLIKTITTSSSLLNLITYNQIKPKSFKKAKTIFYDSSGLRIGKLHPSLG